MNVSKIFEKEPCKWGLRGDPYFWEWLKNRFVMEEFPMDVKEFTDIIYQEYKKLTKKDFNCHNDVFVSEFSKGGMSSGFLSGMFWHEEAIPLLVSRLKGENERERRGYH